MSPLILAAAAGAAYYLYSQKSNAPSLNGPTTDVKGPNGVTFNAFTVSTFPDGTKMVDVFVKSTGARILRFQQTGSDMNSRVFIISPPGVDKTLQAAAMRAYGVRPKAA